MTTSTMMTTRTMTTKTMMRTTTRSSLPRHALAVAVQPPDQQDRRRHDAKGCGLTLYLLVT
jgi:hypothetical protein